MHAHYFTSLCASADARDITIDGFADVAGNDDATVVVGFRCGLYETYIVTHTDATWLGIRPLPDISESDQYTWTIDAKHPDGAPTRWTAFDRMAELANPER